MSNYNASVIYSIVETAKANNLKPFDYVQYLLEEISQHMDDTDCSFMEALLPWSEKLTGRNPQSLMSIPDVFEPPFRKRSTVIPV